MKNRMGGLMVSVLAWSAIDRGLETRSGQTKRWLVQNQNNLSEWSDMSTRRQLTSIIKIQRSVLVKCKAGIISSNVTCSRHDIADKFLIWRYTTIIQTMKFYQLIWGGGVGGEGDQHFYSK